MSISHPQIKDTDRLIWVFIIVLACVIAFSLLKRDSQKKFGAVSYGAMPSFRLVNHENKFFDTHQMKGQVWVVHFIDESQEVGPTMNKIVDVVKRTWTDKRHLYILTIRAQRVNAFKPLISSQYILSGSADSLAPLQQALHQADAQQMFLIDQNGIIRGMYRTDDSESLRAFVQGALNLL